ncbi:MAG: hypothetical protein N2651_00110, partial [Fimbriimonadales bacterium]|nr:hypothetical protein [Fimbriimonadales bacterium]
MRNRWWIAFGLFIVALGVFAWQRSLSRPLEVVVASVKTGTLTTPYSAEGVVKGWQATLSLPAPAQVAAVLVREGGTVRKGQPLVRFWEHDVLSAVQTASARR